MRRVRIGAIAFVAVVTFGGRGGVAQTADSPPRDVHHLDETQGLKAAIKTVFADQIARMKGHQMSGQLEGGLDLDKVRCGREMKVYRSTEADRKDVAPTSRVKDIVCEECTLRWMVPMWYGDVVIGHFVLISDGRGKWRHLETGFGVISQELGAVRKEWPIEQGYTVELVDMRPGWYTYYFSIPEVSEGNLTPLEYDTVCALGGVYGLPAKEPNGTEATRRLHSTAKYKELKDVASSVEHYLSSAKREGDQSGGPGGHPQQRGLRDSGEPLGRREDPGVRRGD
jgi:hypothetical protein